MQDPWSPLPRLHLSRGYVNADFQIEYQALFVLHFNLDYHIEQGCFEAWWLRSDILSNQFTHARLIEASL